MRKKGLVILGVIVTLIIISIISILIWYNSAIKAPSTLQAITVEIQPGTSTINIIKNLKQSGVIKSELATKIYIKLNGIENIQAGKYEFNGGEDLNQIFIKMASGKIKDESVTITFKEGRNIRYIVAQITEKTNNTANDVYKLLKDKEYISSLINKYWFLTKEIENESIYYPLEGYLYPETYTFENKDVEVKTIFEKMLDQTGKVLSKYKGLENSAEFYSNQTKDNENLTAHELLTIASIIELEGNSKENRTKIARVIYNRLNKNMSLGSDVTTYYGIKVDVGDRNLTSKEIETYNAYNTRGPNMAGKLPVGPIANPSEESIKAALNPADGSYLYFVADKNGDIYFTNSNEEHIQMINKLKKQGLWYEY